MSTSAQAAAACAGTTRRQAILGGLFIMGAGGTRPALASAADADGVSHAAEAIHQELLIAALPARVYAVLTQARLFDRLTQLSGAAKSMRLASKPAQISAHTGGAFALFGGYISGRFIELVQDRLIVQAWRVGNWNPGIYSIARFELNERDQGTKIVFDHTGFPAGAAEHLAAGWYANYWDPLQQLLRAAD